MSPLLTDTVTILTDCIGCGGLCFLPSAVFRNTRVADKGLPLSDQPLTATKSTVTCRYLTPRSSIGTRLTIMVKSGCCDAQPLEDAYRA